MATALSDGALSQVEVEIHAHLKAAIITLRGEHDLATQPRIIEALTRAGDHSRVLVDLSECTFADSSVVGALLRAHSDFKRRETSLEVVIPPEATAVRRLAERTALAEVIHVHAARNGLALPTGGEAA